MSGEELCEYCFVRPATTLLLGSFACYRCRNDLMGWPPIEQTPKPEPDKERVR